MYVSLPQLLNSGTLLYRTFQFPNYVHELKHTMAVFTKTGVSIQFHDTLLRTKLGNCNCAD